MAKEITFSFMSKDGKTGIHAVKWVPDTGNCRGILQITHGMIEYIERYREFAQYMTDRGYLVVGHDHLGHGESVISTEEWGYFAPDYPSDILVADMHTLRTMTQQEHPGMPYIMLGHSMGSYMLRKYLVMHGEGLSGAVIMGTGSEPDIATKSGLLLVKLLAGIYGWHHHSRLVQSLVFGKYSRKFDVTGKDYENSWLTKDMEIVAEYYSEPKCTFSFTLNGYKGLLEAVYFDNQRKNIDKIPKKLPILLISGKDDPIGNMGKGVCHVYEQYQKAKIEDVTIQLYENDRHEILNETDRNMVYQYLTDWMDEKMNSI